ncbi:MAG: enoyl-CoA hydratase [Pseudomonadales bacterium]|nr:enoyl-CoA hydratase [Pseudomonadales bacterium]
MPESVLLVEKKDGVATLTLNRPNQMNALSLELRWALQEVLTDLRTDNDIGVVILTGAGRGFCAGLDLKEMGSHSRHQSGPQPADPPSLLRAVNKPIIGAINGVAITGGFEISLSCDLLVVTPEARFADTHARVGLIAGWGLGARLSRAVGLARAKELSLTGNFLSAATAYEWGLVNRVVAAEDLLPTCHQLAQDMRSCVPEVMNEYKRQIDHAYDLSLGDAMTYEVDICRRHKSPPADVVAERRLLVQARARAILKDQ